MNDESQGSDAPTRVESSRGSDSDPLLRVKVEDLLADRLLATVPRTRHGDREVPSIGGIPLLSKLGQGGMGAVYLGYKERLRQLVAVKVLPLHLAELQPHMRDRFVREAQIAVAVESPHLVRVTDVNDENGLLYIVMEYVTGTSAGALLKRHAQEGTRLSEAQALELCVAATTGLAAAHAEGIVHRDVKPDNILIPFGRHDETLRLDAAKLSDLGLARYETGQAITATDIGMGTPGYMAPEQAMSARTAGKAADVFSMGATLYALLSGRAPFTGPSSAAVVMATIQQPHPPIRELREDVSEATAALIDRSLSKHPQQRFADAAELLEALREAREGRSVAPTQTLSAPTISTAVPQSAPAQAPPTRRTGRWIAAAAAFVVALAVTIWFARNSRPERSMTTANGGAAAATSPVRIGIAYSSEKSKWLPWAAAEYRKKHPAVTLDLVPMGEQQFEDALLNGDHRLNVWAPASSLYRPHVESRWTKNNGRPLTVADAMLSLSPQVFVMYESRYAAFKQRYGELSFATLRQAIEAGEWGAIAKHPEWGPFTFAISDPERFNNGLTALCLMSAEYGRKEHDIKAADVTSPQFRAFANGFDPAFQVAGNPIDTMHDFVLKGPSSYAGMFTYEALALEMADDAADRWEPVHIVYPRVNLWSDARYYVLDVPWSSAAQRQAATDFMNFITSDDVQQKLVSFSLRPADMDAKLRIEGSPFVAHQHEGVTTVIDVALEPPDVPTVEALLSTVRPESH